MSSSIAIQDRIGRFGGARLLMAGLIAATLAIAACSPSAASTGSSAAGFGLAFCGAAASLAGNQADMKTFYSDSSSYEEAVAALDRVRDRTQSGIQQIEAAGRGFQPGASVATRFADNQKELLSILADFKAVAQTGNQAAWTAARNRYTAWYETSVPMIKTAATDMLALGVTCA